MYITICDKKVSLERKITSKNVLIQHYLYYLY